MKEPTQHRRLAVALVTFHRDDVARRILVVESQAEEAIRANERPRLGAIGKGPAKDPPTQGPDRDLVHGWKKIKNPNV